MADNEGPKRSDFQESSKLPACGPGCEVEHGDQADPEQLELMHLRAEVKRLRSTSQELEIDRLRTDVATLRRYVDEAIAACGEDRVTGQPLADVIRELKVERAVAWARLETPAGLDLAESMLQHIATERKACAKVARGSHPMEIIVGETKQAYGARLANIIAFEIEARSQK